VKAKGAEGDAAADADYVVARVGEILAFWNRTIERSTGEGRYDNVFDALEKIQKHYPGTEEAAAAGAKLKELKADPAVKAELDAWKKLEKLIEDAHEAKGDEKKLKAIRKKLEKFLESNGSSKAAKRAQQLIDALGK
jgi:hypothetical protein